MKNGKWLLLAGLVIMMMTIGCEKQMGFVAPSAGANDVGASVLPPLGRTYNTSGSWFLFFYGTPGASPGNIYPISIGQDNGATGSYVRVWKDAAKVYAEFTTFGNWFINEAHFDVKLDSASLTHNKSGNLTPGKFPGQAKFAIPYPQVATIELDWNSAWDGQTLAMAALCKVAQGEIRQDEFGNDYWYYWNWNTGCGGEGDRPYKNVFQLPEGPVWISGVKTHSGPRSYWDITLSGVDAQGGPFLVKDGHWVGWCGDFFDAWNGQGSMGGPLQVTLRNSLGALPSYLENPGWDNVSWLVNEYSGRNFVGWPVAPPSQGFVWDMEYVIWYLLGQLNKPTWEPAQTMATRAETEGEGYSPRPGDWFAVICDEYPEDLQLVFIEVDP